MCFSTGASVATVLITHPCIFRCLYVKPSNASGAWWCHQMEIFSTLLALCERNPPVTSGFPLQRPLTWSFDDLLICARKKNNQDACGLRYYHLHSDVTVMEYKINSSVVGCWRFWIYFCWSNIIKWPTRSRNTCHFQCWPFQQQLHFLNKISLITYKCNISSLNCSNTMAM